METTLQKISRKTGRKPVECRCQLCQRQCSVSPCLGTPEDIERILDAGHGDGLAVTYWMAAMMAGYYPLPIIMVQLIQKEDESCVFFSDGLCRLHAAGLKPTEGRLSHHSTKLDNFKFGKSISWNVAKEWLDGRNAPTIERIIDKMNTIEANKALSSASNTNP